VVESVEVAGRLEDKVVVITGAGSGTGREAAVLFSAGVMLAGDESVVDTDEMVWEHVLRVNATGVFLCCKRGIPPPARARERLGDQRRLLRRADGSRQPAGCLYGLEGRGAVDDA
jgi:NAD(P)-dependent dehydrogenase (short-subunit alcohol dehydrogenase family)